VVYAEFGGVAGVAVSITVVTGIFYCGVTVCTIADRLRVVARYYFLTNAFLQDEVINSEDCLEVLRRYLTAGDNDNFAWMLIKMTGWAGIRMTWEIPSSADGYHSLVRAPNGRYLDIHGWSDIAQLRQRFFLRPCVTPVLAETRLRSTFRSRVGQDLIPGTVRLAEVIRNLPYEPFNTPEFQLMANVPLKGADPPQPGTTSASVSDPSFHVVNLILQDPDVPSSRR
jgi:hypothetical protein